MQSTSPHHRTKIGLIVLLGVLLLVEDLAFLLSLGQQFPQSATALSLYALSLSTILTFWVYYDSVSLNASMGMDQAMYIFFGWPLMFPVYAFRSRGFRSGSLLLISFLGLSVLAFIAAFAIIVVLNVVVGLFSS